MFEIREKRKTLHDGKTITTWERDVVDANILEVEAGTTGYRGGDAGHGGRTYFRISCDAGTSVLMKTIDTRWRTGIEVTLGGDAELRTTIEALEWIAKVLREEAYNGED